MTILLASSEVFPYSKTGGLADMSGALATYLAAAGQEVAVVTPLYPSARKKLGKLGKPALALHLPLGAGLVKAAVHKVEPLQGLTIYFIDQPGFYDRAGLYGAGGLDYPDNAERFVFFSKCVTDLARQLKPQIVHVHDWRQSSLAGILNGVDYMEWKTVDNPFLKHSFSADDLGAKKAAKLDLQAELGLPQNDQVPLFGSITRLVDQKGIDILLGALEEMLGANLQFVLLGSGEDRFEKALSDLAARYPLKAAVRIGYDHGLSHRIEAGSDFFLMPSRFEPCGLNQMYSLRYGTIPIVRVTGGLDDSVTAATEDPVTADGIKFDEYSPDALAKAIRKALVLFEHPEALEHFRLNAIERDFSWTRTAAEYLQLFESMLT
jgi:glycogen synthase